MAKNITPQELKDRLDAGDDILVVDVREDWELEISQVESFKQIVLNQIPTRAENEIPKDKDVVFVCRSGGRSMQAAQFLSFYGWKDDKLFNLDGGILRWAQDIDPSLPLEY